MSTCQILMVDEVDSCHLVSGNADFHTEVTRATRGQPHARNIFGGTPSERVGESFIVRSFEESAYKFEVPCSVSALRNIPDSEIPRAVRGSAQRLRVGRKRRRQHSFRNGRTRFDRPLHRTLLRQALDLGRLPLHNQRRGNGEPRKANGWIAPGRLPRVYDEKGKRLPMKSDIAFSIWAGYSYYHDWKEMVKDWLIANGPRGDVMKLATFVRTYLGRRIPRPQKGARKRGSGRPTQLREGSRMG